MFSDPNSSSMQDYNSKDQIINPYNTDSKLVPEDQAQYEYTYEEYEAEVDEEEV